MPSPEPLDPSAITIQAVQFVGTNVEMTYLVDAPASDALARLEALFAAKLGLYAVTATGEVEVDSGGALQRFSVLASPLDRLFHKIGPSVPLTVIKHASVTLDLSNVNLARQGEGLMRSYPGSFAADEVWTAWDAGKLLGTLMRTPELHGFGDIVVAGVPVPRGDFPHAILPSLPAHVAEHGGVQVLLPRGARVGLAG